MFKDVVGAEEVRLRSGLKRSRNASNRHHRGERVDGPETTNLGVGGSNPSGRANEIKGLA